MSYQSDYSGAQVDEAVGMALNPDATPTDNSTNLVESGGVYDALAPLRSVDATPTPSSTNLVQSGGVASALAGKASIFAAGTTGATSVTIQLETRLNIVLATRGDSAATFALAFRYNNWQIVGTTQSGITIDSTTGVLTIPSYTHYKIII